MKSRSRIKTWKLLPRALACQIMVGKHILVSGSVQGVGFRFFIQKKALELGLNGWVRNLLDGRVEILVTGSKPQIDGLLSCVAVGPPSANVVEAMTKDCEVTEDSSFHVRPTGRQPWPSE